MLDRIVANWPLKLLALAFAFAIWVFVTGEDRVVQDFSVPLVVQVPEDLVLTSTPPTTVTVRVRGSESQIRRLDPVLLSMQVALDEADPGEYEVPLGRRHLGRVPRGVDVAFVEPDRVTLAVEERAIGEVAVEPTFVGQPPEGYTFYGASATPERVRIVGPRAQIEQIKTLRTSTIRLDQRRAPAVVSVTAVPDRPHVQLVDDAPIAVRVEVDADPIERRFGGTAVRLEGQRWRMTVEPPRVTVELSGPPRVVERITTEQVRVVAAVAGLEPSAEPVQVALEVRLVDVPVEEAARVSIASVTPSRATVRVDSQRLAP